MIRKLCQLKLQIITNSEECDTSAFLEALHEIMSYE